MAEEEEGAKKPAASSDEDPPPKKRKAEEHVNHERWLISYADFITLLFAFFTVLYATAQADKSKTQAAEDSMRKAFEGPQLFRSTSDDIGTLNTNEMLKPFPIEFLTAEGLLDKHEVNRNSTEDLHEMKEILRENELADMVDIYEFGEGIQIKLKEKIYFQKDSLKIEIISMEVYTRLINLLKDNNWSLIVEGHASADEGTEEVDAIMLATLRAHHVAKSLMTRGVRKIQVVPISYGNSRPISPDEQQKNQRVEFILRKVDMRNLGRKVY